MEEQKQDVQKTLEEKLQDIRSEWTQDVKMMAEKMKDLSSLQQLMNVIYIKRQECEEYIAALRVPSVTLTQEYKKAYVQRYQYYKMNAQLRYTSDAAITTQIEVELEDVLKKSEMLKIHLQFMTETLETIDKMILGLKYRIEIYQLMNGIKF